MRSNRRLRQQKAAGESGLPIRFERHVFVDRPIAEVLGFIADVTPIPKWNYCVLSVET